MKIGDLVKFKNCPEQCRIGVVLGKTRSLVCDDEPMDDLSVQSAEGEGIDEWSEITVYWFHLHLPLTHLGLLLEPVKKCP